MRQREERRHKNQSPDRGLGLRSRDRRGGLEHWSPDRWIRRRPAVRHSAQARRRAEGSGRGRGGSVEQRGADEGEGERRRPIRYPTAPVTRSSDPRGADEGEGAAGTGSPSIGGERTRERRESERGGRGIRFRFSGGDRGQARRAAVYIRVRRAGTGPAYLPCRARAYTAGRLSCPSTALCPCRAGPGTAPSGPGRARAGLLQCRAACRPEGRPVWTTIAKTRTL
jgi:hypothetical protein